MSVVFTTQSGVDERAIRKFAPALDFMIAFDQIQHYLATYCSQYPTRAKQLRRVRRPIYGPPRKNRAYAAVCGDLEVQFRIAGLVNPPPGAVIEVLGYDWR